MLIGVMTNIGKEKLAGYLKDNSSLPTLYWAFGTGGGPSATAAAATDVGLSREAFLDVPAKTLMRKAATIVVANGVLTASASWSNETNGATGYWTGEFGLFDATTGGNMFYHGFTSEDGVTAAKRYYTNATDTQTVSVAFTFANGTLT